MLRQARALNDLFTNKRFVPEMTDEELAKVLRVYAGHRRDGYKSWELEPNDYTFPDGWTVDDEQEWFHTVFDVINHEVWDSVVNDEQLEEYRQDLYTWMPYWIRREFQTEDEIAEPVEKEKRTIDPFLLDHGTAKQRRAAVKRGD